MKVTAQFVTSICQALLDGDRTPDGEKPNRYRGVIVEQEVGLAIAPLTWVNQTGTSKPTKAFTSLQTSFAFCSNTLKR